MVLGTFLAALVVIAAPTLAIQVAALTDTTPPSVSISSPANGATVKGTILWTVSATDNVGIKVVQFIIDGNPYTADSAAPYSVGVATTALSNGQHTLLNVAYDTSMNSAIRQITINVNNGDTTPPAAPQITSPASGTSTSDTTPTFTGTAEASSTVKVYDGASTAPVATATASSTGSWSATTSALTIGSHSATAKSTDAAGNTSPSSSAVSITVTAPSTSDTTPPAAPRITSPTSGTSTSDTTPTFSGTAEASSTVRVYDGTSTVPIATTTASSTGSWSATPSSAMAAGTHSATAKSTDAAGNTSPSSSAVSFTITATQADTVPPVVSITSPRMGATVRDTVTVSVSATDNVGVTKVEVYLGGSLKGTDTSSAYSFSINTYGVKNGYQTLMAKAFDQAGNISTHSILIKVVS